MAQQEKYGGGKKRKKVTSGRDEGKGRARLPGRRILRPVNVERTLRLLKGEAKEKTTQRGVDIGESWICRGLFP